MAEFQLTPAPAFFSAMVQERAANRAKRPDPIPDGRLEIHPANLAILPAMRPEDYESLKSDIAGLGQRHPILLYQGRILDGKHRYKACLELGIKPWCVDWEGGSSITDLLLSENQYRRHLSPAEREATARRALEWHRESARKRAEGRRNG